MKRFFYIFLSFFICFVLVLSPACFAIEKEKSFTLDLNAPSCVLMEESSGEILYEKNIREKRPCASITKVMTLILTFEAIEEGKLHLDDVLTASAHASSMGGSDIWLKEGEEMSVDDLIKATVVMSANDAAVVLAEEVAGSEEAFVSLMNEKAVSLNMLDTTFKNCNGLDEEGHLTSALDVAIMSRELLKHEKIFDYTSIWIDYIRNGETQLVNTNKLIKSYKGITGLKTGTTSQAKSCITATAKRDELSLIAVVLGADNTDLRFADAKTLLNYGFSNYKVVCPDVPVIENVKVLKGMKKDVPAKTEGTPKILLSNNEASDIKSEVKITEDLTAPINKGDKIGEISFKSNSEVLYTLPILAADSVEEISFKGVFNKMMELLFK